MIASTMIAMMMYRIERPPPPLDGLFMASRLFVTCDLLWPVE
jgi:hypothetical protein